MKILHGNFLVHSSFTLLIKESRSYRILVLGRETSEDTQTACFGEKPNFERVCMASTLDGVAPALDEKRGDATLHARIALGEDDYESENKFLKMQFFGNAHLRTT